MCFSSHFYAAAVNIVSLCLRGSLFFCNFAISKLKQIIMNSISPLLTLRRPSLSLEATRRSGDYTLFIIYTLLAN